MHPAPSGGSICKQHLLHVSSSCATSRRFSTKQHSTSIDACTIPRCLPSLPRRSLLVLLKRFRSSPACLTVPQFLPFSSPSPSPSPKPSFRFRMGSAIREFSTSRSLRMPSWMLERSTSNEAVYEYSLEPASPTSIVSLSTLPASEVELLPPFSIVTPSPPGGVPDSQDHPQTDQVIEQSSVFSFQLHDDRLIYLQPLKC